MTHRTSLLTAGLFIVLGEFLFASMGASIRVASANLPNEVVVFFRNLFGLILLLPWFIRANPGPLATQAPGLHVLRAAAGISAMYLFFYALANIHLAEAMLLKLTAPIFMPLIALVWLREDVPASVWLAVGIGFCGILLILAPGTSEFSPIALAGLLGGVAAALAKVTVRRLSRTEPPLRIVFYFALIGTAVTGIPLIWSWQTPNAHEFAWLLAVAGLATLGQLALTNGLARAPASRMAAFGYSSVVFGAIYGWIFWAETIGWRFALGSVLIAAAGLLASYRKRQPPGPSARTRPLPYPS